MTNPSNAIHMMCDSNLLSAMCLRSGGSESMILCVSKCLDHRVRKRMIRLGYVAPDTEENTPQARFRRSELLHLLRERVDLTKQPWRIDFVENRQLRIEIDIQIRHRRTGYAGNFRHRCS